MSYGLWNTSKETMSLVELIHAVKAENLTKTQLEVLYTHLCTLKAEYHLKLSDLKREEAKYILESEETSAVAKKDAWRGSESGQDLIRASEEVKVVGLLMSSTKNRLFSNY